MNHTIHQLLRSATLAFQRASARPSTHSGGAGVKFAVVLAMGLFLGAMTAQASHFRGASLTWKRLASPANTIELTVTESWCGASGGQTYSWGDTTTFNTSGATVIASGSDITGTFTVMRTVLTHTYATLGPWTISAAGSARIASPLVNANLSPCVLQAVVDLNSGNQGSPVISSAILLQMNQGELNTVPISFADVDGDPVTFRMATAAESGIPTLAGAGGGNLAVSSGGILTWDTSFTAIGQVYAAQVLAFDNHPVSSIRRIGSTKVFFDFLIQIVDGSPNHPPVASGNAGPFTAAIGVPFSNVIIGTDPDGGTLTVTHLGLPMGATMTPASGTTAAQPLSATFNWTPTLADAGSAVGVTIVFTDPDGLTASKSFSISVPADQPPVADAGPDQTIYDIDGNAVPIIITLNGSSSYDPEHAALTYHWTQTGGPPTVVLTGANTATPSFTAPALKLHPSGQPAPLQLTFRVDVSDGKSTRSDDALIIVKHNNLPPGAVATAPATAPEGSAVTLDASGSSDPDQDPLSYTWTQTAGTLVNLANNGTNNPLMVFSDMVPGPHSIAGETLKFTVTVSDGIDSNTSPEAAVFIRNVNTPPMADAGDGNSVFDNFGTVTLHGSGTDFDGDPLSYHWAQVAGPAVALNDATSQTPSFIAPPVSEAQGSVTLTFQLITNDSSGPGDAAALDSAPSTVDIQVKHANRAPVADAGQNRDVPEQTLVTLDGSGSYDPDTDPITYVWTQTGGPAVVLDTTAPAHPTFSAPDVGPAGDALTFALVVTDIAPPSSGGNLSSKPSSVTLSVKYVNRPPLTSAGAPQVADEGSVVTLNGSGSDPDGNAFTYLWTQTGGPAVTFSDATVAKPTFTAPAVDRFGATVTFALQTKDQFNAVSNLATTYVGINNINHVPVADAGVLQSVPEGSAVSLTGAGLDHDTEEQPLLTYAWVQTAGPVVALTGADTTTPSFTAPLVTAGGDPNAKVKLKFQLTVTDPNNASATASTCVSVTNVEHAPLANAGGIYLVNEAAIGTLDGSLSSDPDGDALTYAWVQTAGVPVTLSNANTAYLSFTAPFVNAAGTTLKFSLTVNDGFGGLSSDTATVSVKNINDPPTLVNPRTSLACLWPPNHQMVKVSILGVVDPNNNATIRITRVTQDEATNGLGDGDTAIDAMINADGTVMLRAERSGKGNGRVYHVHFTASDIEGSVSGVVNGCVPHDKQGDIAIDGGELFDSTH